MNWLDIILIIVNAIIVLVSLGFIIWGFTEEFAEGIAMSFGFLLIDGIILIFTLVCPFVVLDRGSGSTVGTITSVDKNFFGTTAIYIKTSETEQEKYCIEDKKIAEQAKKLIGKDVKVSYGERVGFYSTSKCGQAPINKIEVK